MPCFCLPETARNREHRARLRQAAGRERLPNFEQATAVAIQAERVGRRVIARVAPGAARCSAAATASEA